MIFAPQEVMAQTPFEYVQPTFATKAARQSWTRAVGAYKSKLPLVMQIRSDRGTFRISMDSGRARQDGKDGSVSFVNGKLQVRTKKRTGQRKEHPMHMQDFASNSGVTLEPTLVAWSLGRNPVGILAKPGAKARIAGEMVLNGVRLDILDLDSPGYHAQLLLRKVDGLPVRITTKITDRAKKSLGSTSREFSYLSVGKKLSDRVFSLSTKG